MKLHWGASLSFCVLLLPILITNAAANEDTANPYYSGCLQAKLGDEWKPLRTCSSDDPIDAAELELCQPPPFDNYLEIRIQARNWDSITVLCWLGQIILSELLGIPTTIEAGPEFSKGLNFYAPESPAKLEYSNERYFEVVGTPLELPNGDCRFANQGLDVETGDFDWQYCAHWIPEVWDTDGDWFKDMIIDGKAEPSQGMGILGKNTWFITKFTADADPTLDSYHGLVGESNRRKLAETFKRPTTWKQYCEEVSRTNCTQPDATAKRPPKDEAEAQRLFFQGQFTGHFRNTPQNDCDANPNTCTGHIANFPCSWQSRMSATLYHLDIALSNTDGPNEFGSYTVQQQIDVWDAANATRSNLIMLWWTPEPLYHRYLGTDAELQRVQLTPVTSECMEGRWESVDECSDDLETRVGTTTPLGVCEEPPRLLQKVVAGNLFEVTHADEPAIRSPAYDMLRRFRFSEHQLGEIFQLWETEKTPRDAVCTWAANNLHFLKGFVPYSYPRVAKEETDDVFSYVLMVLAGVATIMVCIVGWQVQVHRAKRSLRYAQLGFLRLLLVGSLLVGLGSLLNSAPATNETCVATIWLINIGYTLELVPLIVKISALNRMMTAAKRMSRITLTHRQLYGAVAVILALCTVFLAIWTVLDPPQKTPEYSLSEETNDDGETIVGVKYFCQEQSVAWQYVAVGWNTILLMCAAVLAFQTRSSVKAFNESGNLAVLITSHFFFVLLRCGTFLMSGIWKDTLMIQIRSLIYVVDTVATLLIYFLPKLLAKDDHISNVSTSFNVNNMSSRRSGSVFVSGLDTGPSSMFGRRSHSDGAMSLDDELVEPLETAPKRSWRKKDKAKDTACPTCGHKCTQCAMGMSSGGGNRVRADAQEGETRYDATVEC